MVREDGDIGPGREEREGKNKVKLPLIKDPNLYKKIIWGLIMIFGFSAVVLFVTKDWMATILSFVMMAILAMVCIKDIGAEYKGFKITLWTPNTEYLYTGGAFWRLFLLEWFYLFPTEQIVIDIPKQQVITEEKTRNGKTVSSAVIDIDSVLYAFWPDNAEDLVAAYKKAPDPFNEAKLFKFFAPYLAAVIRRIAGRFDWIEVQQTQRSFTEALSEEIQNDSEGPFAKSRIKDFTIQFQLVILPTDLSVAISKPQIATFNLEAGKKDAELDRIKKQKAGEGDAYARKQLLAAMKEYPVQAINIMYEEMAKGQASTIFFELPSEMKSIIGQGGEIPEELKAIWDVTPKSQRSFMVKEFLLWLKNKK